MATGKPIDMAWPLSSAPGATPQESGGRLINCYAEPLGQAQASTGAGSAKAPRIVWRGCPGFTPFALAGQTGYRGGLLVANLSYECYLNNASTVDANGNVVSLGNFPGSKKVSIARNQRAPVVDVVAVDIDNGAFILSTEALANASIQATIGGTTFNATDTVALTFANTSEVSFPVTVTYTLGAGESATTVAAGLKALINANATLTAAVVAANNVAGVLTITQSGRIGNATQITALVTPTGGGNETVTLSPVSGFMAGGTGTPGINFTGTPLAYNGGGNLPQPNGVCFHHGYFHFSIGDNRLFASGINALTQNSQTFQTCNAKATGALLRPIPFNDLVLAFTTASIEVYQDTAQPFPAYPYTRLTVLEIGLIQANAVAGFEDGFSELLWVAQDFGVYHMTAGGLGFDKVSNPDLDRLVEAQINLGNTLEAYCYIVQGKKFWGLSSPAWTWEFNISTQRWHERSSLDSTGNFKRWRGSGGHPAFGKWLIGDTMSQYLHFVDDAMNDENGAVLRFRMESGPVADFPNRMRVPRADFNFVTGVGQPTRALAMNILGAISGTNGQIRLNVLSTARIVTGDAGTVANVTGTVEANGTWQLTVIDGQNVELVGSIFVHAYVSGGVLTDLTTPPNVKTPTTAISWSDDNGVSYRNPRVLGLGEIAKALKTTVPVKHTGMSGPQARRWRIDISDPIYRGFLGSTQSTDPRDF